MTQTNVIVRFQIEGFHNFPAARDLFPEVAFLADRHRHIFHFEVEKKVNHDDRDVEFILFKREVTSWLINEYGQSDVDEMQPPFAHHLEFGPMSCEMIAKKLLVRFDLESASVFEDGENGSKIFKT